MSFFAGSFLLGTVCRQSKASVAGTVGVAVFGVSSDRYKYQDISFISNLHLRELSWTAEATNPHESGSGADCLLDTWGAGAAFTPHIHSLPRQRITASPGLENLMMN
jgi:hypothetical protein